jgi:hypothetical protein
VIRLLNWASSVATILTLVPVAAVNLSAMACVACTRSVWFSRLHTVRVASPPPSSSLPHALSAGTASSRPAARTRRDVQESIFTRCPLGDASMGAIIHLLQTHHIKDRDQRQVMIA